MSAAGPGGDPPPIGRITRRPDYLAAAKGRRFHTERLTAQGRLRDDGPPGGLRVGFTVTKREGHATERNRIRRRLKVAARQAGEAHRDKAVDVVLIGRRDALAAPFAQLVEDVRQALGVVTKPRAPKPPAAEGGQPARKPGRGKRGSGGSGKASRTGPGAPERSS
ncbi:ribonuclease P protein component [Methylobacterium nonmethylotrophicum]|uniref:Ribonuclease P protein component n=1 Tax=Methylobacterium nonmethylotrophicum TaxID=1141884 RepID=A0A4Z0NSL3_9HYPH|nr:ribonuclease P protein component [Methylobacterium nonmethylotrophicum]TGE00262.1 ribonuclease P protein component [Methylobacterium nonmethylotrophicum]